MLAIKNNQEIKENGTTRKTCPVVKKKQKEMLVLE